MRSDLKETHKLQFLRRGKKLVLQELLLLREDFENRFVWEDVPTVEEEVLPDARSIVTREDFNA